MKVLVAGDYVPKNRVAKLVDQKDYQTVFGEVKPLLEEVDYAIVNLEAPVINGKETPIVKTGPNLKCTANAVESIQWAGFDCVTLANNHFRDQGEQGVRDTLSACDKYGIDHVGGGLNLQDARQILYKEIKGEKLAVVNFCENEWSIASDKYGGSAPLNPVQNYYQIQEAKQNADYVLVIVHGGIEMYQYPTPRMQETYRFFIDAGADAVVNHHQHCYSGYEVYQGKPIFYGLGNFCFDKNNSEISIWNIGYLVNIHLQKNGSKFENVPYCQNYKEQMFLILKDEYRQSFEKRLWELNGVIGDKVSLTNTFKQYVDKIKKSRLVEFEPLGNKYLRALQLRKLFPSLISNKTKRDVTNYMNCESHREIILKVLLDQIENE